MIEKRYSDGKLAKWYYSQENVISDGTNEYYLASKESIRNVDYSMLFGTNDLLDELNRLSDENEELKQSFKEILKDLELSTFNKELLEKENEQLKQELHKFRKWEKWVRDVKREDVDRIFKMSIYEIAEAFDYYKRRIKELEGDVE